MTTKQQISAALKSAGYNSKEVTIRSARSGFNSCFTLTIRDAAVNGETVKAIAENLEEVRHCEASGEILSGANSFIRVEYTPEVKEQMSAAYLPAVDGRIEWR